MGFYGSRADIKRKTRDAVRPFFIAETYAPLLGDAGAAITSASAPALAELTLADHHDFVTGTSVDAVVAGDQLPRLAAGLAAGQAELAQVTDALAARMPAAPATVSRALVYNASSATQTAAVELEVPTTGGAIPAVHALADGVAPAMALVERPSATIARFRVALTVPAFGWQAIDVVPGAVAPPPVQVTLALLDDTGNPAMGAAITQVVLANARTIARWRRANGSFALVSLAIDGSEAIAQPSVVIGDYRDDGGLWRLGHEMPGCALTPIDRGAQVETVQVLEQDPLAVRVAFAGGDATREAALAAADAGLDLAIVSGAAVATTRTASLALAVPPSAQLATSVPGGWARRPTERIYTPTFWAAVGWAQVGGWAILLRQSTGVHMDRPGALELMVARDAREETCILTGGTGSDPGVHRIEWRIVPAADELAAARAAQAFDRPLTLVATANVGTGLATSGGLLTVTGGIVSAIKPADRGGGVIVRAVLAGRAQIALSRWLPHGSLVATDLVERDREALPAGDTVDLDPAVGSIATVRLVP